MSAHRAAGVVYRRARRVGGKARKGWRYVRHLVRGCRRGSSGPRFPPRLGVGAMTVGKRWKASDRWGGWHRGMICGHTGHLCTGSRDDGRGFWLGDERSEPVHLVHANSRWPDTTHPGTLAFLLRDVRKALGERVWCAMWLDGSGWYVLRLRNNCQTDAIPCATHPTAAEALLAALLAAPK